MGEKKSIVLAGGIVGLIGVVLVMLGNPANMGFCIACFLRDIAGALGLQRAGVVQYMRPEIMGLVLGSFLIAMSKKEFDVRGGSSPIIRFVLGMMVMIGALMFLGCPLRLILRLAGGDLNAILGLIGFTGGILCGIYFLNKGFSLKRSYKLLKTEGIIFPTANLGLIYLVVAAPAFIFFSTKGPGAMHAPLLISLAAGLIVGVLAQRTRLCLVGGIRDYILFKDSYLLLGFISILVVTFIGNMVFGFFNFGFAGQPVAHVDGLWNFLGMVVVGWGSVLLGGCPLRQLILAGEGNTDSVVTVLGLLFGGAIAHNFTLASSPKGPSINGQIAVVVCIFILLFISYFNSEFLKKKVEVK